MADLSITAANVLQGANPNALTGTATVAIAAGQPVYRDTPTTWALAKNDTAAHAAVAGIALNSAAIGQPVQVQTQGNIVLASGAMVIGQVYVVSNTSGMICPNADLTSGQFVTVLGVCTVAGVLSIRPIVTGVAYITGGT